MAQVVRANILGFCMGVRRAVDLALHEAEARHFSRVYTMGPLIHNPQVMETLKKAGVETLTEGALPADLRGAAVIIRAHGIGPALEVELVKRGARIVDATCPHVKASQKKARSLSEAGYTIFLAGEKDHGELIGIRAHIAGESFTVAAPEEATAMAAELSRRNPPIAKTALIGQTTISAEEYAGIGQAIRCFFPDLEIVNSICGATRDRQEALRELCGQVDAVIVAGGRESANTRRLLAIAEASGKKAWLVEGPGEIPPEAFSYPVIGLSAGASTPDETVDGIERRLSF